MLAGTTFEFDRADHAHHHAHDKAAQSAPLDLA